MVRNRYELKLMRESGKIAALALKKALTAVRVGVSELEIDKIVEREIYRLGGDLSYKSVPGYKYATCITVNEQVVHGIPTERKLEQGDLVSIDLAVEFKGWHTDCAWTVLVRKQGTGSREQENKEKFLQVGEQAMWEAIVQAVEGNKVGDISNAIQTKIEGVGYSVVRSLVGHGIGKSLHEEPEVPGYGKKGTGLALKEGMSLAIEVIYAQGTSEVSLGEDGWTFFSVDRSWAGLFEMTVVVGKKQAEVLTDWRKV
ncbi:type I methionyl aminopeptidase [Candidatus Microgenomates bacterium]|nr:type I methionyl aminopeptidase [Candidatus Microgenomates bacterium]